MITGEEECSTTWSFLVKPKAFATLHCASEHPINSSKVAVVCPKCKKAVKVGYKVDGDKKVRVCKSCGAEL